MKVISDGKFADVGGTTMTGSLTRKYQVKYDFTSNNLLDITGFMI